MAREKGPAGLEEEEEGGEGLEVQHAGHAVKWWQCSGRRESLLQGAGAPRPRLGRAGHVEGPSPCSLGTRGAGETPDRCILSQP